LDNSRGLKLQNRLQNKAKKSPLLYFLKKLWRGFAKSEAKKYK